MTQHIYSARIETNNDDAQLFGIFVSLRKLVSRRIGVFLQNRFGGKPTDLRSRIEALKQEIREIADKSAVADAGCQQWIARRMPKAEAELEQRFEQQSGMMSDLAHKLDLLLSAYHKPLVREVEAILREFSHVRFGTSFERNQQAINVIRRALKRTGYRIRDPKSGHPAMISFKRIGNAVNGRFVCEYRDPITKKKRTGYSGAGLPLIELVPNEDELELETQYASEYDRMNTQIGSRVDILVG